jgi:hypothetical protein
MTDTVEADRLAAMHEWAEVDDKYHATRQEFRALKHRRRVLGRQMAFLAGEQAKPGPVDFWKTG